MVPNMFNLIKIKMIEIDQMLEKWIHNSIIRNKLRELIVSAIHTHAKTIIKNE